MNMVEVEISVLVKQCFRGRRLSSIEHLRSEVEAWCWERNWLCTSVDWRFTASDAHIKLCKLYPSIDLSQRTRCYPQRSSGR
jgi:hypothetical protein